MTNSTTISIKGRDDTKKAFASVDRGLQKLPASAQKATRGIGGAFEKLTPRLGGLSRALKGVGSVLSGPLGITLGAGAATTALAAFTRSAVNAADELGKAATRTGVSVEALSSLEVAARQGGTSFSALEKGLARLSRNAVDASDGLGEASRGFDRLGISVTDSNGELKDTDTLYAEIATELSMMENGTKKTAIAQELFGRTGSKLIPVLNSGAKALSDNVTTSTLLARSSEALNDRMDDIRVIFGQVGNAILRGIIPPLASLLTSVVNGAKELRTRFAPAWESIQTIFNEVGRVAGIVVTTIGKNLGGTLRVVGQYLKTIFNPVLSAAQGIFGRMGGVLPALGRGLRLLAAGFVKVQGEVSAAAQQILGAAGEAVNFSQVLAAIVRLDFAGAKASYDSIGDSWKSAATEAANTRDRTNEAVANILNGVTETGNLERGFGNVNATVNKTTTAIDDGGGAGNSSMKGAITAAKEELKAVGEAELARFQQYKTNAENTRVIDFTNHNKRLEEAEALHIKRLGYIDLETARQINADIDSFTRRQNAIDQTKAVQDAANNAYVNGIRKQNEELNKQENILETISKTIRSGLQAGIEGLIKGTTSWGQALQRIGQSILDTLIKKFAQLATNSIFNIFTGGGGGLGSLFGAGAAAASKVAGAGAGAGAGAAAGGLGGIGKALGGVASALAPLAVVAAPFAIGSLFRKGESDETKRRRALATNLDVGAILEGANQATAGYVSRPRGNRHPNRRERDALRRSLDDNPERKIRIALSSSIFRNADKDAVRRILEENIDKFQFGGIVNARRGGRLVLAGEGGQNEAIVPLPNGRAIPVEIKGGNAGRTINFIFNIEGLTSDQGLEQRIENALLQATQPGGILEDI